MVIYGGNNKRRKILQKIITKQSGYFTAKQALKAEYSYRLQYYHKSLGHWNEIDRGVFRLDGYPESIYDEFIRWSLWSRNRKDVPQGTISHDSALSMYELGDVLPTKIHLTVPKTFRKKAPQGCILHKNIIKPDEIERYSGFSMTKPLKTIIDVTESGYDISHLAKVIKDALDKGILRPLHFKNVYMSKTVKEIIWEILKDI